MKTKAYFFMVLAAAALCASGQERAPDSAQQQAQPETYIALAGDLPPAIRKGDRPYYIAGDIYVAQGATVEIEAGCVFLFKNFTGFHIQGKLVANGTPQDPVVFTSENDSEFRRRETPDAAPFDWNGVFIHKDGSGSELHSCAIRYSVDGLVSETRFVRLGACVFFNNGRASLTIEGVEHEPGDAPYDYALSVKDAKLDGVALSVLSDPLAPRRNVLRYAGLALAVGGAAAGIVFSSNYNESARAFDDVSSKDASNLAENTGTEWENARSNKRRNFGSMMAGWGVMVCGAIGFSISFRF